MGHGAAWGRAGLRYVSRGWLIVLTWAQGWRPVWGGRYSTRTLRVRRGVLACGGSWALRCCTPKKLVGVGLRDGEATQSAGLGSASARARNQPVVVARVRQVSTRVALGEVGVAMRLWDWQRAELW